MDSKFPGIITSLPEADIPFHGIQGWLSQAENHQLVFFEIEADAQVTEHAHAAQWGIVIEGEMEMIIGGVTETYRKGDTYYIPDQVKHSAVFKKKTRVIDFFADPSRYRQKR
jgi:quercetin dioxygenase-like cupin family protein